MGEVITVLDTERQLVQADANTSVVVTHGGGSTVYYGGAAVSSTSNDGSLTSGNSVTLTTSKHFISAGHANIRVATAEERGLEPLDVRLDTVETNLATAEATLATTVDDLDTAEATLATTVTDLDTAEGTLATAVTNITTLTAAAKVVTANTQVVSYTLALTDAGKCVEINHATDALVVTVPLNATIAFPTGSIVEVSRLGDGTVTITPEGAVTIPNVLEAAGTTSRTITTRYGSAFLRKRGTNEWVLTGGIS